MNPHGKGIVCRKREQYSLGQASRLALLCSVAVAAPGMAMAQPTDQSTNQRNVIPGEIIHDPDGVVVA